MAGEWSGSVADKTTDTLPGRRACEWMDIDRLRTCEECGRWYWCWLVELSEADRDLCVGCQTRIGCG